MNTTAANSPRWNPTATRQSLHEIVDLLDRARVDNSVTRLTEIKDAFLLLFVRLQRNEISRLEARDISNRLRETLTRALGEPVHSCSH